MTDLREYAWDYFQLHANQRLATFNFYIAVSTLVATGLVASFHKDINMPFLGIILGLLLMVFSYLFYRLDERNRVLVHYGEEALKLYEREFAEKGIGNELTMFLTEEQRTKEVNGNRSHFAQILRPYTYTNCFCAIFWTYGAIGAVGIYVAVWKTLLS
jgi:ABC-type transport system involved in cytochrome bd biosynthesis fused ATPase/permease subunit